MPKKKEFMIALGERAASTSNTDELLSERLAERKIRRLERADRIDELKEQAEIARLQKEAATNTMAVERVEQNAVNPPQQGFTVKGGLDMGTFSIPEMMAKQDEARAQAEMENKRITSELAAENRQLQEQVHKSQMEILQSQFQQQVQILQDQVRSGMSQKSFAEQYTELLQTAETIGLKIGRPEAADARAAIETLRLEQEMKREERKFQREMKESDRQWELRMIELQDQRSFRQQELDMQKSRNDMLAKAPEVIGRAAAQAILDAGKNKGNISKNTEPEKTQDAVSYHIEAGVGDSGEVDCPNCGEKIGIGPSSVKAKCVGCGGEVEIKRIEDESKEDV